MNVKFSVLAAAGSFAILLTASGAGARDLTVVSWGGAYQAAQKQVYFDPFKTATGLRLNDESWDGGIGVLRAKIQGGASPWDMVQVESEELLVGCEENLFVKMDYAKAGGIERYLPGTVHECGIGTIAVSYVLAYDKDKLTEAPKSWVDFFDVKQYPGKRGLRLGPATTLEIALMGDGVAPKDVYKVLVTEEGVERAFKKLDSIRGDLIWWKAGAQPPQLLASGEVVMTNAYNGRIDAANREDKRNFGIVWEGAVYTIDYWVILKDTPNLDAAYRFLDFAGMAENQANLSRQIAYGPTSKQALTLIDKDRLASLPTAPGNFAVSINKDAAFWLENLDRLTERFNKWASK